MYKNKGKLHQELSLLLGLSIVYCTINVLVNFKAPLLIKRL